jgi:tRNA threonylcarbamoyl adenosine modification protein YeaZ
VGGGEVVTAQARAGASRWRLVLDTATRRSVVAVGDGASVIEASSRESRHRHGVIVLDQVAETLERSGVAPSALGAIGVGIGPGSFTGLRVGLATAKTLAWTLHIPIVGLSTTDALVRAARATLDDEARDPVVVLPAGARDVFVAVPGRAPRLVPVAELGSSVNGQQLIPIDLDEAVRTRLGVGEQAHAMAGMAAQDGLPTAMLAMLDERLAAGSVDDAATLVPAYVALPHGVSVAQQEEVAWSPDLR